MSAGQWTRLPDLRQRLERYWQRGDLLREALTTGTLFPLELRLKAPGPKDLTADFSAVRDWVAHWQEQEKNGLTLRWKTTRHQQLGSNALPRALVLPDVQAALGLLRRGADSARFLEQVRTITRAQPALAEWCARYPHRVLSHQHDWPRLLAVVRWLQAQPRPGVYLRQLELPGVHTKLIEANRGLLGELLDQCLPEEGVNQAFTGARGFEARYGFRRKPLRVRFRLLDPALAIQGLSDLSVPVTEFARLTLPLRQVFIVENDVTALALPDQPDSLVIFGQGYGVDELLAPAEWLHRLPITYWGDLDTHGFAILDQLRKVLPRARSMGMDLATLKAFPELWGTENKPTRRELIRLTEHEQAVYQGLLGNQWGNQVRLEQERIPISHLMQTTRAV